jgi:hypothetical protein
MAKSSKNPVEVKFRRLFIWMTTGGFRKWSDLELYHHSPVRICVRVRDTLMPEAWFKNGGENLGKTGFSTTKELADFLLSRGVKLRKKPKPYKPTPPLYD